MCALAELDATGSAEKCHFIFVVRMADDFGLMVAFATPIDPLCDRPVLRDNLTASLRPSAMGKAELHVWQILLNCTPGTSCCGQPSRILIVRP